MIDFERRYVVPTLICLATSAVVAVAVEFAVATRFGSAAAEGFDPWLHHDARDYADIAEHGYEYRPGERANVAFFPAFPAAAAVIAAATGASAKAALLVVAAVSLLAAFVLLRRWDEEAGGGGGDWTLLAFGLWPTTCFFRLPYTESPFLAVELLFLVGLRRNWSPAALAAVAGLATATRVVGVAFLPALLVHLWRTAPDGRAFARRAAWAGPLACWGLAAFMAFQRRRFGDPLAFVRVQDAWTPIDVGLLEQLPHVLALEPLWGVYAPDSPLYWRNFCPIGHPLFSLQFANPLFWLVAVALVAWGAARRRLLPAEAVLAFGLLAVPFVTHGYRSAMLAEGRYAAVAGPAFLVLGRLLGRLPRPVAAAALVGSTVMLFVYSFLYAGGSRII